MPERPIVAIMYDFDKTLSPRDMQEYAFIPGVGMEPDAFWAECRQMMQENCMDLSRKKKSRFPSGISASVSHT